MILDPFVPKDFMMRIPGDHSIAVAVKEGRLIPLGMVFVKMEDQRIVFFLTNQTHTVEEGEALVNQILKTPMKMVDP